MVLGLSGGGTYRGPTPPPTELFGLVPSTLSKRLAILYQAWLVNTRKDGRWVYYSLPGKDASAPVRTALAWVAKVSRGRTTKPGSDHGM